MVMGMDENAAPRRMMMGEKIRRVRLDLMPETIYEDDGGAEGTSQCTLPTGECNQHLHQQRKPSPHPSKTGLLRRQSTLGRLLCTTERSRFGSSSNGGGKQWLFSPLFRSRPPASNPMHSPPCTITGAEPNGGRAGVLRMVQRANSLSPLHQDWGGQAQFFPQSRHPASSPTYSLSTLIDAAKPFMTPTPKSSALYHHPPLTPHHPLHPPVGLSTAGATRKASMFMRRMSMAIPSLSADPLPQAVR